MAHKCMELRLRDPSGLHLGTLNFIGAPRHLALSACEDEAEGDIRRQPMRKSMVADSRESSDVSGPAIDLRSRTTPLQSGHHFARAYIHGGFEASILH